MTEKLLQYIWQFLYFNTTEIESVDAEPLVILHPGNLNTNQGPDFINAKIKVGDTLWAGHVELHILSSDWVQHKHSFDKNYNNVVLHVVWENDASIQLPFPTLELQDKVPKLLLKKYEEMMAVARFIPCEKNIQQAPSIVWDAWKERMLIERLQQKSALVKTYLQNNNNHWEETFWWLLARNFGVKINSDSFEKIARSLPITILAKHKNQVQQIEALLFGQALLLTGDFKDSYMVMLQKEYQFLQKKYQLLPANAPLYFLRMRPSNFPTVRLAQLAMLVHNSVHLFSVIKDTTDIQDIKKMLDVTANDYWHYHYMPDEESAFKEKRLGAQMADNLLINTVIPILFTYGYLHQDTILKDRALQWMEQIAAEKNNITKGFESIGIANKSAFDSQALIQLKNNYCNNKRCLECAIGNKLLRGK
jgi:hypothetical protein